MIPSSFCVYERFNEPTILVGGFLCKQQENRWLSMDAIEEEQEERCSRKSNYIRVLSRLWQDDSWPIINDPITITL